MEDCLILLGAYAVGGVPCGLLIGKLHGVDVRQHGSGNIGATNVWRVCGPRWGLLCLFLDALKGLVPVWLAQRLPGAYGIGHESVAPLLAVLGAVCGHVWSPYLRFRGGKGVATSAGAVLALAWLPLVVAMLVWALTLAVFRYMSVASMAAALALPISGLILRRAGYDLGYPVLGLLTLLAVITVVRHRSNLQRLRQGKEPKFGARKEEPVREDHGTR